MTLGIVGGTGEIGEGMALRFSQRMPVIVGSRDAEKAVTCCQTCEVTLDQKGLPCTICGTTNQEAIDASDIIILAIPFQHLVPTLSGLHGFEGKVVVTPVNPIRRTEYFIYAPPPQGSAALLIQEMLPANARVCAAFNNIAANRWRALNEPLEYSVVVCGDDADAKQEVMNMASSVPHLVPLDGGPIGAASMVESITPLLLNIARYNRIKDAGVRFG